MHPTQRALWQMRSDVEDPAPLNLAFGLLLDGPFEARSLEWALQAMILRHESLRTKFYGPANDPVAEVISNVSLSLEYIEASFKTFDDRVAGLLGYFHEASRVRLDTPPLLRAQCLRLEPDQHLLLLTFNHLAVDGWALELFGRETEQLYSAHLARASSPLPSLDAMQVLSVEADAQAWRRGPFAKREIEERRRRYSGLATRSIRPFGNSTQGIKKVRRRVLAISPQTIKAFRDSNTKGGISLFPAMLTAVAIAVCRHCGLDEIVVSTLIANRHTSTAQRVLGAQYGASALRIFAPRTSSPSDVLHRVVDELYDVMSHRLEISTILELLGQAASSNEPVVPSCMVLMDRQPMNRLQLEDVTVRPLSTLTVEASSLHNELELAVPFHSDFVVFLRQYSDSAGISIFWDPKSIPNIDSLADMIVLNLKNVGCDLELAENALDSQEGHSTVAVALEGWRRAAPAVDALSPLPIPKY